jgi:hypothetical protein
MTFAPRERREAMSLVTPFWFKQRQCNAEPHGGDHMLKVTGPNLGEAYLYISLAGERWRAGLRLAPGGADVSATEPELATDKDAWDAAFELYREHFIV